MNGPRVSPLLWGGLLVACACAAGSYYLLSDRHKSNGPQLSSFIIPPRRSGANLPVLFPAPSFSFVDQNGRAAGNSQLNGRVWIADFIFTHCAGMCPKVTAKMVELQKSMEDPDVRFVSFSVDPERDDPATLREYAKTYNAGDSRWMLLRPPDRKTIQQVAQKMAAVSRATDMQDEVMHTDFFLLMDTEGKARGLYDSKSSDDMERLKSDAKALARQRTIDKMPTTMPAHVD